MGTSGNRDCQRAFRSELKDFTEDAFTISVSNLLQNGAARMLKAVIIYQILTDTLFKPEKNSCHNGDIINYCSLSGYYCSLSPPKPIV